MQGLEQHILNMLNKNLGIKPLERVLILVDKPSDKVFSSLTPEERKKRSELIEIADITYKVVKSRSNATKVVYESTGVHAKEPPPAAWEGAFGSSIFKHLNSKKSLFDKLLEKEPISLSESTNLVNYIKSHKDEVADVVIAYPYYSTSHTTFRKLLTSYGECRYASLPLFEPSMFYSAMNVNWDTVYKRSHKIASLLTKGSEVQITTPEGTNLFLSIKDRKGIADTGIIHNPGEFGNLPGGEAFIAPVEGTAKGKLVLYWGPTAKFSLPVTMHINEGVVTYIEGDDPFIKKLTEIFKTFPAARNIAELGIGTNDGAKNPANILESEKILGTIHIACGDNSSFGGKISVPFHQDFIIFKPTVWITFPDGEKYLLLKNGKLLIDNQTEKTK